MNDSSSYNLFRTDLCMGCWRRSARYSKSRGTHWQIQSVCICALNWRIFWQRSFGDYSMVWLSRNCISIDFIWKAQNRRVYFPICICAVIWLAIHKSGSSSSCKPSIVRASNHWPSLLLELILGLCKFASLKNSSLLPCLSFCYNSIQFFLSDPMRV